MRIRAPLILAIALLGVMALSGAALAATKTCSNNPCLGTKGPDKLKGNATKNEIRALRGADYIAGKPRADEPTATGARMRCAPAKPVWAGRALPSHIVARPS
jgi:hypothetical protein